MQDCLIVIFDQLFKQVDFETNSVMRALAIEGRHEIRGADTGAP